MSQRREQVAERVPGIGTALDRLAEWYHVPVLVLLVGFMLWVRINGWERFVRDGRVFFSGNDAWYHYRTVNYTVQNWPFTMPFDPWTYFPYGTASGQFGTFYDQIVATIALVVGLGDPSEATIGLVLLFAPAVFGALIALPAYFIGDRMGGRFGGILAVLLVALAPSSLLQRSLVGFADHHAPEAFFQAVAILAVMAAVTAAERDKPVYELFREREYDSLRSVLVLSALAGLAIAMYVWTWPPGVFLVGVIGVFFVLALPLNYVRRESPEHVAIAGVVMMATTTVLMVLPMLDQPGSFTEFSSTDFTLLQVVAPLAVAAGCAFMAWLAREWDSRGLGRFTYPTAVGGLIAAGALLMAVATPDLWSFFVNQLLRVVGFTASPAARTISEVQPLAFDPNSNYYWVDIMTGTYGLAFFSAALGAVIALVQLAVGSDHRSERLLVVVWAVFFTAATFTQIRFGYYLVVPVAALNAYLAGVFVRYITPGSVTASFDDVELYQVLAVVAILMLVAGPLVAQGQTFNYAQPQSKSPGEVLGWDDSLQWLEENTPAEGDYGGAGNADQLEYYGAYGATGDFAYPDGAYGVMSWWDYGHFITTLGHRIPNANPFQQGANTAAEYLLADNETEANDILGELGDSSEQTRYVMVDYKMVTAGSKFGAPTVFNDDVSLNDFYSLYYVQQGQSFRPSFYLHEQRYYESQMVRLYQFHGSRADPQPIVIDWEAHQSGAKVNPSGENASIVRRFDSMSAAREFVREDGTAQVGGIRGIPSEPVPALEHYRTVHVSRATSGQGQPWVKTFERVPGATVEGTGPANTTVTASVEMRVPTRNSTFTYRQQARTDQDGSFTMRLPYSTTGYDEWGLEAGYTNVSVRATGPYRFATPLEADGTSATLYNGSAEVSEGQVLGESDAPVEVSLEETTVDLSRNGTVNNSTTGVGNGTGAPANGSAGPNATGNGSAALAGPSAVATDPGAPERRSWPGARAVRASEP